MIKAHKNIIFPILFGLFYQLQSSIKLIFFLPKNKKPQMAPRRSARLIQDQNLDVHIVVCTMHYSIISPLILMTRLMHCLWSVWYKSWKWLKRKTIKFYDRIWWEALHLFLFFPWKIFLIRRPKLMGSMENQKGNITSHYITRLFF